MKVLASDFDNTLYFKNGIGFKDIDILKIKQFQQEGHLFGLCSGRPFSGLLKPLKGVLEPDFFIVSTGGAILDKNYHLLYGKKVPFDIVNDIYLTYCHETELIVQTLSQDHFYCTGYDHFNDKTIIQSFEDMRGHDIYSISLVQSTVDRAREITAEINARYPQVRAYQNVDSIDIVEKSCSKGQAILTLKSLFHLDTIAGIGDSYNDLPMLEVVDHAFTFHRSPMDLRNKADDVVETIAEAIERLNQSVD